MKMQYRFLCSHAFWRKCQKVSAGFILVVFAAEVSARENRNSPPTAGSCEARDFSSQLGPNRKQGDLSWCFAYSSADLITQKVGFRVSAAGVATDYLLNDQHSLLFNRDPKIRKFLADRPKYFSEVQASRANAPGNLRSQKVLTLDGLGDSGGDEDISIMLSNIKGLCREKDFPSVEKDVLAAMRRASKMKAQSQEPSMCIPNGNRAYNVLPVQSPVANSLALAFQNEVDKKCKRVKVPTLIPRIVKAANSYKDFRAGIENKTIDKTKAREVVLNELDRVLNSRKAAAIGYSASAITPPDPDDVHADHSSVVSGRKMMGGQCHYLLRNTWGDSCKDYLKKFQDRCVKGNIWMTRDELAETLYSVTSIE